MLNGLKMSYSLLCAANHCVNYSKLTHFQQLI